MLGLGAYMLYLSREAGDPLLFSRVSRSHWARHLANPISTLERAWDTARAGAGWAVRPDRVLDAASVGPSTKAMDAMNVPVVALAVALLIAGARRLPLGLLMYSAAVIGLPILVGPRYSPFTGMPRYLLSAFPLFFVAGMALARSRWVAVVWLGLGSALGVVWTLWFVSGRWA
jgi:hypothetical protein